MIVSTLNLHCVFLATALGTASICGSQESAPAEGSESLPCYLVVSLVESTSEYFRAAEKLAERHKADVVSIKSASLEDLLEELKKRQPSYVAFVLDPADLDINLVNRLVVLSTQVDSDPFVDFAWGVITGRDGAAAERLVEASEPGTKPVNPSIAMFGVGGDTLDRSMTSKAVWPMRNHSIPVTSHIAKGESDEKRDAKFISEVLPTIGQASIILLASHGYPDGLVAGPKAKDLKGIDLKGCILLNIACYTGVTAGWYDQDYQTLKVRRNSIDPDKSFCLQAIDCGVAGYFAYTCPRPAGPTLMGDALLIASSGQALGDRFRENQQSIVLAHLLSGDDHVKPELLIDGASLEAPSTPGQAVKQFSTGGVLFGDPAFKPFDAKPDSDPRVVEIKEQADLISAEMKTKSPIFHFFAGDQVNYWDDQSPALRMECMIPLKDRSVEKINVVSLPEGISDYRGVAAVEETGGQRYLRVKINFAQPVDMSQLIKMSTKGLSSKLEILTSSKKERSDSIQRFGSEE